MIALANNWKDYELIDCGDGMKLERWKDITLYRPDPQAIWPSSNIDFKRIDAIYHRSKQGGGNWQFQRKIPNTWNIQYNDLTFKVSPTGFKHTGLFPEQAVNWDWMSSLIQNSPNKQLRILNLFAYTGGATMACSKAGAKEVVHVDASKGMVQWAKENRDLCHLQDHTIRFIVDDVLKFVQREKRRGNTYHGIIMDPPSYGRGPNGEIWKFEKEIVGLLQATLDILDKDALFFLINSYTTGFSSYVLEDLMKIMFQNDHRNGTISCGEIGIPCSSRDLLLPCGIFGRWQND